MTALMSRNFWTDTAIRAIRTMAQTALASMTVGATVSEVNWGRILSASVVAGVYSVLMSVNNLTTDENGTPSIQGGTAERPQALPDEAASAASQDNGGEST